MDSTVVRNLSTTAVLVGEQNALERVAALFEAAYVRVVSSPNAAAAGNRLADVMPQVVVILGTLRPDERSELTDKATAVGALVMNIDPELDRETLDELVNRAVRTALERRLRAETNEHEAEGAPSTDEVDEGW